MRSTGKATYSFEEAVNIIIHSNSETLEIIASVLSEEKYEYCLQDLYSFKWIIEAKRKELLNTIK